MKKVAFCLVLMLSLFFVACEKEGPVGPSGKDGNANVMVFNFTNKTFTYSSADDLYITVLEIPELTSDVLSKSVFNSYLVVDNTVTDLSTFGFIAAYGVGSVEIGSVLNPTGFYNFRIIIIPSN